MGSQNLDEGDFLSALLESDDELVGLDTDSKVEHHDSEDDIQEQ